MDLLEGGLISSINYSEALAKMIDKGFGASEAVDGLAAMTLQLIPFDKPLAESAAFLRKPTSHKGLSIADRACLALAISRKGVAITADRVWSELDVDVAVAVIR